MTDIKPSIDVYLTVENRMATCDAIGFDRHVQSVDDIRLFLFLAQLFGYRWTSDSSAGNVRQLTIYAK